MFDDMLKGTKRSRSYEDDYKDKCPYCGSYNIKKRPKNYNLDHTWDQKCACNSCNRKWTLIFSPDFSQVRVRIEKPNKHDVFDDV